MLFFTKNIQYLKTRKNTNIAEIVARLGSTFPYLASGEVQPSVQDLLAISECFRVSIDDLLKKDLEKQTQLLSEKDIRFLVLDVDGTLTDGGMYFTTTGEEMKKFNAKDGRGIIELAKINPHVGLTGCPADAVAEIREIAHIVLSLKGGEGCVREFIDDFVMSYAQRRRVKGNATTVK